MVFSCQYIKTVFSSVTSIFFAFCPTYLKITLKKVLITNINTSDYSPKYSLISTILAGIFMFRGHLGTHSPHAIHFPAL